MTLPDRSSCLGMRMRGIAKTLCTHGASHRQDNSRPGCRNTRSNLPGCKKPGSTNTRSNRSGSSKRSSNKLGSEKLSSHQPSNGRPGNNCLASRMSNGSMLDSNCRGSRNSSSNKVGSNRLSSDHLDRNRLGGKNPFDSRFSQQPSGQQGLTHLGNSTFVCTRLLSSDESRTLYSSSNNCSSVSNCHQEGRNLSSCFTSSGKYALRATSRAGGVAPGRS